jgi:hypothetical protein
MGRPAFIDSSDGGVSVKVILRQQLHSFLFADNSRRIKWFSSQKQIPVAAMISLTERRNEPSVSDPPNEKLFSLVTSFTHCPKTSFTLPRTGAARATAWKTMNVHEQRVRFVVEATQKARPF